MFRKPFHFPLILILLSIFAFAGCETGLEPPPPPPPFGTIEGVIHYEGTWPPADSLYDLRFVAFKETPSGMDDFFDLSNMIFSQQLEYYVERDTFLIEDVQNAIFRYNVVAQQYGPRNLVDWRPVGVYEENFGVFAVEGDTAQIVIQVDFNNLPPFPPQ